MKNQEEILQIVKVIAEGYNPDKIILFGSHATGKAQNDSDLDFFIIKKTTEPYLQRSRSIRRLFRPYPCAMDIFVYTPEEYEMKNNIPGFLPYIIANEGVTVYERIS
jgi:uncharacterized protein